LLKALNFRKATTCEVFALKVLRSFAENFGGVSGSSEKSIAIPTEEPADFVGLVVVVNVQPAVLGWVAADQAQLTALHLGQFVVDRDPRLVLRDQRPCLGDMRSRQSSSLLSCNEELRLAFRSWPKA
jgi:hypothetical protein